MSMPTGDTPEKVNDFYLYLNSHQQTTSPVQTWHVDWFSLAWLWGFAVALIVVLVFWVKQYRTTRERTGIYPVDSFGGWTTETARPATRFFLLLSAIVVGFAAALIFGHLVWGQKF
jgi:predicted membrane protein